jgi:hypothetical protein
VTRAFEFGAAKIAGVARRTKSRRDVPPGRSGFM